MPAAIAFFSILLLAYWFRYISLLVLRTKSAGAFAFRVAAANQLSFPKVQVELASLDGLSQLDRLEGLLNRDYQLLRYLIRHGSNFKNKGYDVECWVLHADFRVMQIAYGISRRVSRAWARKNVTEMAEIVVHLAQRMGETAAQAGVR